MPTSRRMGSRNGHTARTTILQPITTLLAPLLVAASACSPDLARHVALSAQSRAYVGADLLHVWARDRRGSGIASITFSAEWPRRIHRRRSPHRRARMGFRRLRGDGARYPPTDAPAHVRTLARRADRPPLCRRRAGSDDAVAGQARQSRSDCQPRPQGARPQGERQRSSRAATANAPAGRASSAAVAQRLKPTSGALVAALARGLDWHWAFPTMLGARRRSGYPLPRQGSVCMSWLTRVCQSGLGGTHRTSRRRGRCWNGRHCLRADSGTATGGR